jgi:hypothetical protein
MPDRPHGVDDIGCWQQASGGDHGFPGRAAALRIADRAARVHDGRAARAMNRAIDATTAQQAAIGRVDDGIHFHPGNIAVHDLQVFPCHGVSWSPGLGRP